ncbi:hypothetical protein ACTGW8_12700, partial [Streptococcus suis]
AMGARDGMASCGIATALSTACVVGAAAGIGLVPRRMGAARPSREPATAWGCAAWTIIGIAASRDADAMVAGAAAVTGIVAGSVRCTGTFRGVLV